MIERSELDSTLERACNLIDRAMVIEADPGHVQLTVDDESLAFTRNFISGEIARFEKRFPTAISDKARLAEVELGCMQLKPLKLLMFQIDIIISSKAEDRATVMVRLNQQVRECRQSISKNGVNDNETDMKPAFKRIDNSPRNKSGTRILN